MPVTVRPAGTRGSELGVPGPRYKWVPNHQAVFAEHPPHADQVALYGVLAEIEALGLELLEVRRLPPR
jgi:hypothetical protein